MTARYGSFDTHIAMVYDILCNKVCIIECHKMAFLVILWPIPYDIECQNHSNRVIKRATSSRQIKLWIQNQQLSQFLSIFRRKMLKLKRTHFPLYFWAIFCQSLCKFEFEVNTGRWPQNQTKIWDMLLCTPLQKNTKWPSCNYSWTRVSQKLIQAVYIIRYINFFN